MQWAIDQAGGSVAAASDLHEADFDGYGGTPLSDRAVRTWYSGHRKPDVDVFLALVAMHGPDIEKELRPIRALLAALRGVA